MLDFGNFPLYPGNADVQIFTNVQINNTTFSTWRKPRGKHTAFFVVVGGGSAGGSGFSGAASSARGGGGGGGSSPVATFLGPLALLPDVLWLQVGAGGLGGASPTTGGISYICYSPQSIIATNTFLCSGGGPPGAGATGTATAGGAGGAATSAPSVNQGNWLGLGVFSSYVSQAGVAGGAQTGANGTAIAIPTAGAICQAGSGGAGTTSADFAGGAFTQVAGSYLSQSLPATPAAGSFNGSGGVQLWKPFFCGGGGGGSSSNAGIGGVGGNGARGGGGGGGGGGTTGGRGGNGGDGIIIIISW